MVIEQKLVTVIINCFNGGKWLENAINSVISQSYSNLELILWDNHSSDDSAEIFKRISISDTRLRYIKAVNHTSLGKARNLSVKHANGEYIAFIDCDDIWCDKDKLQKQISILEADESLALCYTGYNEVNLSGEVLRTIEIKKETGFLFKYLLIQYDIAIVTSVIRSKIFKEFNFDENIEASEEYCLYMQIAAKYKIGVLKDITTNYLVDSSSLTSKKLQILGDERRYTLRILCETFPELNSSYKKEIKIAKARADYYDSRYLMTKNEKLKAFQKLIKNSATDFRYFLLSFIALFSKKGWEYIHLIYRNRL